MTSPTVLSGPWQNTFEQLVSLASTRLTLCAPYVSDKGAESVRAARQGKSSDRLSVLLLTDLSPIAVCAGATDPTAVASIGRLFPYARTVHLPRLHAKVYAADGERAVVTSGNLTHGGLQSNHECGLFVEDARTAQRIEQEINKYAALGAEIGKETLDQVCDLAVDARAAYQEQTASASKETTRRLRVVMRSASDTLVRARLAGGAIHTVFERTIEFLLRRHGPLTTEQIQPLIQQIHPDLCDDSVDRVIDGTHFGKKWKHAERTAQQHLKKRGLIVRNGRLWSIVE